MPRFTDLIDLTPVESKPEVEEYAKTQEGLEFEKSPRVTQILTKDDIGEITADDILGFKVLDREGNPLKKTDSFEVTEL